MERLRSPPWGPFEPVLDQTLKEFGVPISQHTRNDILEIFRDCTHKDAERRKPITLILEKLKLLLANLTDTKNRSFSKGERDLQNSLFKSPIM